MIHAAPVLLAAPGNQFGLDDEEDQRSHHHVLAGESAGTAQARSGRVQVVQDGSHLSPEQGAEQAQVSCDSEDDFGIGSQDEHAMAAPEQETGRCGFGVAEDQGQDIGGVPSVGSGLSRKHVREGLPMAQADGEKAE